MPFFAINHHGCPGHCSTFNMFKTTRWKSTIFHAKNHRIKCRCFSDFHPFRALLKWQDPKLFYEIPFNPQCCGFNHVFIFPNFEHRNNFEHTLTVVKQAYFWETTRHPDFSQVFEMFEADSSLRRPPVGPNEVRCDSVLGAGRGGSGGKFQGVK